MCLSNHLYLISFTLNIHLVIQPRNLAPIPMSEQEGQALTPDKYPSEESFFRGWRCSFLSSIWLMKSARGKKIDIFLPLPLSRCTILSLQKAWKNEKQNTFKTYLHAIDYYVNIFLYFHLDFFYPYLYKMLFLYICYCCNTVLSLALCYFVSTFLCR